MHTCGNKSALDKGGVICRIYLPEILWHTNLQNRILCLRRWMIAQRGKNHTLSLVLTTVDRAVSNKVTPVFICKVDHYFEGTRLPYRRLQNPRFLSPANINLNRQSASNTELHSTATVMLDHSTSSRTKPPTVEAQKQYCWRAVWQV